MMNRETLTAIDRAVDAVISKLDYRVEGYVDTDSIIRAVSELTNTKISFGYASFSKFKIPSVSDYGAIMCVTKADGSSGQQTAQIVLNQDKDLKFRRFSLVHELGHLATGKYNVEETSNRYMLCAHIQYNITAIPEEEYENKPFLEAEEIANIFALKVLMPTKIFAQRMFELKNISEVADCFGVTEDAVCSRSLLGL